jgi:hypothetical protein
MLLRCCNLDPNAAVASFAITPRPSTSSPHRMRSRVRGAEGFSADAEARRSFRALLRSRPWLELPDSPLYTLRGILAREAWRFDAAVTRALGALWEATDVSARGAIGKQEYAALHCELVGIRSGATTSASSSDVAATADHEWCFDCGGAETIGRERFTDILFLAADAQAVGVSREATVAFLEHICARALCRRADSARLALRTAYGTAARAVAHGSGSASGTAPALLAEWGGPSPFNPFGSAAEAALYAPPSPETHAHPVQAAMPTVHAASPPSAEHASFKELSPWGDDPEKSLTTPPAHAKRPLPSSGTSMPRALHPLSSGAGKTDASERSLIRAAQNGDVDLAAQLLNCGERGGIDAVGPRGASALLHAVRRGHGRVVALLIERGADVEATDAQGNTALHIACGRGHAELVGTLIAAGVPRAALNASGRPAHTVGRALSESYAARLLGAGRNTLVGASLAALASTESEAQNEVGAADFSPAAVSLAMSPPPSPTAARTARRGEEGVLWERRGAGAPPATAPAQSRRSGTKPRPRRRGAAPPGAHKGRRRKGRLKGAPNLRLRPVGGVKRRTNPRYRPHSRVPEDPLARFVHSTIAVKSMRPPQGWGGSRAEAKGGQGSDALFISFVSVFCAHLFFVCSILPHQKGDGLMRWDASRSHRAHAPQAQLGVRRGVRRGARCGARRSQTTRARITARLRPLRRASSARRWDPSRRCLS